MRTMNRGPRHPRVLRRARAGGVAVSGLLLGLVAAFGSGCDVVLGIDDVDRLRAPAGPGGVTGGGGAGPSGAGGQGGGGRAGASGAAGAGAGGAASAGDAGRAGADPAGGAGGGGGAGEGGAGGGGGGAGEGGAGGGGSAGEGGGGPACVPDASEPNDTPAQAKALANVSTCDAAESLTLSMDGSDDWFSFAGSKGLLCGAVDARAAVQSFAPVRVCYYVSPAASVACPAGTQPGVDPVPVGYAGCCASNTVAVVAGANQSQVLVKVAAAAADVCFQYVLSYQY